jgi:DNA-binding NarL/FixJ family response regulator
MPQQQLNSAEIDAGLQQMNGERMTQGMRGDRFAKPRLLKRLPADSNEGGHLLQSDRGHHSNLMAASLVSSREPVLVISWRRSPGQVAALTAREEEIASLIAAGLSNKEIARRLKICLPTTKSHVHNILGKLELERRGQVSRWLRENPPA